MIVKKGFPSPGDSDSLHKVADSAAALDILFDELLVKSIPMRQKNELTWLVMQYDF